MLIRPDKIIKR